MTTLSILHSHRLVAELLAAILEQIGWTVSGLHQSASELLERGAVDRPALVLVQAEAGGADLPSRLRQSWSPRLLMLLAAPKAEEISYWREAGADGALDIRLGDCALLREACSALSEGRSFFPLPAEQEPAQSPAAAAGELDTLTAREVEVLGHLGTGMDNGRIAELLSIRERTVKAHVSSLYRKLGQENRTELALLARRLGARPDRWG